MLSSSCTAVDKVASSGGGMCLLKGFSLMLLMSASRDAAQVGCAGVPGAAAGRPQAEVLCRVCAGRHPGRSAGARLHVLNAYPSIAIASLQTRGVERLRACVIMGLCPA